MFLAIKKKKKKKNVFFLCACAVRDLFSTKLKSKLFQIYFYSQASRDRPPLIPLHCYCPSDLNI